MTTTEQTTMKAYRDGSGDDHFLDISPISVWECHGCQGEFPSDEIQPERISGNVITVSSRCKACANQEPEIVDSAEDIGNLVLEWLSTAGGKRIVWKEDHGTASWTCSIVEGPNYELELETPNLSRYAFTVVTDDVGDYHSFPDADVQWSYFEDWLWKERELSLVKLCPESY
ncbi:hypothetical protein FND50_12610 [Rhodococcus sp. WB9]|uniref:hypothetical protein n=1 Tax=Rhodococcus sp. WB9 TaxID=2594007 RepID=UPI001185AC73|nr:hypothetical protein [Rhodococcus sp. WB9]QDQ91575.1 hypothetical protein FND50_12610 [Rhodococcus sp. WB9]